MVSELEKIIKKYLFEDKPPKYKFELLLLKQYQKGGLKLMDITAKNKAAKIKWFREGIGKKWTESG